jgi:hypothetical protein
VLGNRPLRRECFVALARVELRHDSPMSVFAARADLEELEGLDGVKGLALARRIYPLFLITPTTFYFLTHYAGRGQECPSAWTR